MIRYSPSTGKLCRMAMPPRDPSGRSSLCRSSWMTKSGTSKRLVARARRRQAGRDARDLPGHRQVPFEMGGRDRQRIREVVEAAVGRLVAGQQRLHVEAERIDPEQIADGVAVLGAVEPMDRADPAGIGVRRPRAVDFLLDVLNRGAIRAGIRARPPGRRHRTGAQPGDDLLPGVGALAGDRAGAQGFEVEAAGVQPLAVAAEAVPDRSEPSGPETAQSGRPAPARRRSQRPGAPTPCAAFLPVSGSFYRAYGLAERLDRR